jgi:hypothetical protein
MRMKTHTPKWAPNLGIGVPMDSRTFREWLQRSKHIALRSFLYHWKTIEMQMSKIGSHDPFGHLQHKLRQKERSRVKLAIWLPTTKCRESTQLPCVQVACDTPLESSWWELQLCFRPHPDRRSEHEVIAPQSCGSFNLDNFETPPRESQDKKPFGCSPRGEVQSILYGGRWWLPLSLGHDESCEFEVARGLS